MSMKRYSLLSLALVATAWGQDPAESNSHKSEAKSYQAPISCTADVPAQLCKAANSDFSLLQQASKAMSEVAVVIADDAVFKQEKERIVNRHEQALKAAAGTGNQTTFFGLLDRDPLAPSMLENSVLFILDDRGLRTIKKVIVSAELFRGLNLREKPSVDKDNVTHFLPGGYDPHLVTIWSRYVVGFVEGWFWSRMSPKSD
jgi:hypothetical protein